MYRRLALLLSCLLVAACSRSTLVTVWSPYPELSQYAELYNKTLVDAGSSTRFLARYYEDPFSDLIKTDKTPDLIVADALASGEHAPHFRSLSEFFSSDALVQSIYADLLESGTMEKKLIFLPLAFDLPLVYFPVSLEEVFPPYYVHIEDIRETAAEDETFQFSPLWDEELLFYLVQIQGASFRAGSEGILQWSGNNLKASIQFLQEWIEEQGGAAAMQEYQQSHLYPSVLSALEKGYASLAFAHAGEFLSVPPMERSSLSYRWLATSEMIPALYEVVYAGIPRGSPHARKAAAFLAWLTDEATQEYILSSVRNLGIVDFGLLGQFSSLVAVNDKVLPAHYAELKGRMPPQRDLLFPPPLPQQWNSLQKQVLSPWILENLRSRRVDSLTAVLEGWYKQLLTE